MKYPILTAAFIILLLLSTPCLAAIGTTVDPMEIGVGARTIALGRCAVAMVDGIDAIFNNPAGMVSARSFQVTSTSTNLFDEINYMVLGATYPLGAFGTLGLGFVNANVSNIYTRDSNGILTGKATYDNGVTFVSYAKDIAPGSAFGFNLKYFNQSASSYHEGNGTGINADFGVIFSQQRFMTVGVLAQNFLGDQIVYRSGGNDQIPSLVKAGTAFSIMGLDENSLIVNKQVLRAGLDIDLNLVKRRPIIFHFGTEYKPLNELALRFGLDQQNSPDGITSSFTAGVGLTLGGLQINYAFYPHSNTSMNASHFVSVLIDEEGWPSPLEAPPIPRAAL